MLDRLHRTTILLLAVLAGSFGGAAAQTSGPALFTEVSERDVRLKPAEKRLLAGYRARPFVADSRLVQVDFDLLQQGSMVDLEVFGESIPVFRDRFEQRDDEDFSWFGSDAYEGNRAVLTAREGRLTGSFLDGTPSGRQGYPQGYQVRSLGRGMHVVLKLNPKVPVPPEPKIDDYAGGPLGGGGEVCGTITLLIAYTPAMAADEGDPVGLAINLVDEFNDALVASQVAVHFNLVHVYETDYDEHDQIGNGNNAVDQDINMFEDRFTIDGDGHMDEVHGKRDTYGADIAVLLGDGNAPMFDQWSGKAAQVVADADTAFAVVAHDYASGPYHWIFHHEVGHVIGARHDIDNDSSLDPFPYGHGYIHAVGETKWRTILAKNDEEFCGDWPGCVRIGHFSNPDVDHDGDPTGNAVEADNARVFEERSCAVAGFKDGPWM